MLSLLFLGHRIQCYTDWRCKRLGRNSKLRPSFKSVAGLTRNDDRRTARVRRRRVDRRPRAGLLRNDDDRTTRVARVAVFIDDHRTIRRLLRNDDDRTARIAVAMRVDHDDFRAMQIARRIQDDDIAVVDDLVIERDGIDPTVDDGGPDLPARVVGRHRRVYDVIVEALELVLVTIGARHAKQNIVAVAGERIRRDADVDLVVVPVHLVEARPQVRVSLRRKVADIGAAHAHAVELVLIPAHVRALLRHPLGAEARPNRVGAIEIGLLVLVAMRDVDGAEVAVAGNVAGAELSDLVGVIRRDSRAAFAEFDDRLGDDLTGLLPLVEGDETALVVTQHPLVQLADPIGRRGDLNLVLHVVTERVPEAVRVEKGEGFRDGNLRVADSGRGVGMRNALLDRVARVDLRRANAAVIDLGRHGGARHDREGRDQGDTGNGGMQMLHHVFCLRVSVSSLQVSLRVCALCASTERRAKRNAFRPA